MKTLKIAVIATIITSIIMLSCAVGFSANAEELPNNFYEIQALVIGWTRVGLTDTRIIECLDEEGNVWAFYDNEEYYTTWDVISLLMWKSTGAKEDDEIVSAVYLNHFNGDQVMQYLAQMGQ